MHLDWQDDGSVDEQTVGGFGSLCAISLAVSCKVKYRNIQFQAQHPVRFLQIQRQVQKPKATATSLKSKQNLTTLLWQLYTERVGLSPETKGTLYSTTWSLLSSLHPILLLLTVYYLFTFLFILFTSPLLHTCLPQYWITIYIPFYILFCYIFL